jgi:aryl-alcohol dehydrogenase-like predicted oxidoreductase/NAD-dependent dihydropyrimidine dehydrogenase PreA subunit
MKYNLLGKTGIKVSELCLGILPMGPLQADISAEEGGELILSAMRQGVNFFDSAQMYGSYPHLRYALDRFDGEVVISGKSVAASYDEMAKAIEEGLQALGRDYFDIFLLHAARMGADILQQREQAWLCLQDYRQKGYIRSIGASTHNVAAVQQLADESDVDIIFPLYNKTGMGLMGGSPEDMKRAVDAAAARDKGLYSMKLLAGGNLLAEISEAIAFGRREQAFAAHAIGMVNEDELALNLRFFNDQQIDDAELAGIKNNKHWQLMKMVCHGCGNCLRSCHSDALEMIAGKPHVIEENCILCGYCAADCPEFAIRLR